MRDPLQPDRTPGFSAPVLTALRPAMEQALATLGDAPRAEQALLLQTLFADQSKALIHLFLAERAIGQIPGVPSDTHVLPLGSAAVVGAGTMGAGIAMALAEAGIRVLLKETDQAALDRGMATIRALYANQLRNGKISAETVETLLTRITPTLTYEGFTTVDLVIEAVFEDMATKQHIFRELDRVCRPGAILASNTSTLDIDRIASAVTHPEFVVGTHFFTPPNVIRLLEIVRGRATSSQVLATCMQLAQRLGKLGAVVGNCRGFVANRMFLPYHQQAEFLVEEGAGVLMVDQTLAAFGMGLGPLLVMDMVGLDVGWRIREAHKHLDEPGARKPFLEDRLAQAGRHGRKTGAGWYLYDEKKRARPDPEIEPMVRRWTAEQGITQRAVDPQEIVERCIYALINEGARIVEEGFVPRLSDIDTIFVHGFGFPAWRGGPMWYADSVGLARVYARICDFQREFGELWRPAPLLERLARAGGSFYPHANQAAG